MKIDDEWMRAFAEKNYNEWKAILDPEAARKRPDWSDLPEDGKVLWTAQTRPLAEAIIEATLINEWHFLKDLPGDISAAFVRAHTRYAREELDHDIQP